MGSKYGGVGFAIFILLTVLFAMFFPEWCKNWGSIQTKSLIFPLIQVIMFGMGATLGPDDFLRALKMPKAVLCGFVLQFSVMPLLGFGIAKLMGFSPELAAGMILVGSAPGGVASNVITYLAKGNVALSVTMTACSTLASPLMTPLLMSLLAGTIVPVDFGSMFSSIIWMIVIPIGGGLIANEVLKRLNWRGPWLDRCLSIVSMIGIAIVLAIIVAESRDDLLTVGFWLILAAIVHNGLGYLLGYWGAYAAGLEESARRTVAIEVGMQNCGMATGLAIQVLNSTQIALPAAIFGPWMSVSGAMLAAWWQGSAIEIRDTVPPGDDASAAGTA
jgi:BASS family bile acid:Na+ symporter